MTAHAVIVPLKIMATNVDTLNRSAVSGSEIDNGMVFLLESYSSGSGESEVWNVTQITTGSLAPAWMAYSPEVVTVFAADGTAYKGINADPRNFYNDNGEVFDAFLPQPGDLVLMSTDVFSGAKSTNTYANATAGGWTLVWGTAPTAEALSWKYLDSKYISIGSGSAIGSTRLTAYRMVCLNNGVTF